MYSPLGATKDTTDTVASEDSTTLNQVVPLHKKHSVKHIKHHKQTEQHIMKAKHLFVYWTVEQCLGRSANVTRCFTIKDCHSLPVASSPFMADRIQHLLVKTSSKHPIAFYSWLWSVCTSFMVKIEGRRKDENEMEHQTDPL